MKSKGNYINGMWSLGKGGAMASLSPDNGSVIWEGIGSSPADVDASVSAAKSALSVWTSLGIDERITYLKRYADLVKASTDRIAETISIEIGKPFWESKTEAAAIVGKLEPSISAYNLRNAEVVKETAVGLSKTSFKPIGVVAVVSPYNFPGHMANGHIMPALLSGNTVIWKPSEKGAMTAELLTELWAKAGLPAGVINLVQGGGAVGEALAAHDDVNGVFFTGSYAVGEKIRQLCGTEKMCALEMGGNSPFVVWDTSNIDGAVLATIQSAYITAGQRCSSARRVIVPNNDFGNCFVDRLVKVAKNILVGKYSDKPEPFMGPLRTSSMVDAVLAEQKRLIALGAKSLLPCERLDIGECYISPGVIDVTGVKEKSDNEIISPFIRLERVASFEDAIEAANDTEYGLAAGIITEDKTLYEKFSAQINAGIVNWNQQLTGAVGTAPFGGVKKSGNYRPSGYFAVDYCVYAVASIEAEGVKTPTALPCGISLD